MLMGVLNALYDSISLVLRYWTLDRTHNQIRIVCTAVLEAASVLAYAIRSNSPIF